MINRDNKKQIILKYLVFFLEGVGFLLIAYLLLLPFYPTVMYKIFYTSDNQSILQNIATSSEQISGNFSHTFPGADYSVSADRLIIKKIGVNAPIIESVDSNYGLSRGAWLIPETSTPDKGGNTVISGHRFKYLPPNNLTFYLFHKLVVGDDIFVIWHEKNYHYKITQIKRVPATEVSILNHTKKTILTLFTCDPIYSTKNRLVVIAEPINNNNN